VRNRQHDPNETAAQAPPTGSNGPAEAAPADETETQQETPEVAALVAERDNYLEQLQRARADFANFRRRTEQERTQAREQANRALIQQLLPVLDDFERALAAIPAEERETPWVAGIAMIDNKLRGVLERQGVARLEALGQPFNPAEHEAIASEPGAGHATVVDVYQPGYRLGNELLRPAMVKVGSAPQEASAETAQGQGQEQGQGQGQEQAGTHPHHRRHHRSATVADR